MYVFVVWLHDTFYWRCGVTKYLALLRFKVFKYMCSLKTRSDANSKPSFRDCALPGPNIASSCFQVPSRGWATVWCRGQKWLLQDLKQCGWIQGCHPQLGFWFGTPHVEEPKCENQAWPTYGSVWSSRLREVLFHSSYPWRDAQTLWIGTFHHLILLELDS